MLFLLICPFVIVYYDVFNIYLIAAVYITLKNFHLFYCIRFMFCTKCRPFKWSYGFSVWPARGHTQDPTVTPRLGDAGFFIAPLCMIT